MTAKAKLSYGLRQTFLQPASLGFLAADAAVTEATERRLPQKDRADRFADGLSRFAINFADNTVGTTLSTGVLPALLRQDPRYVPSGEKSLLKRASYAASRVFVTWGDNGRLQPNYSLLGGVMIASIADNIWDRNTPGRRRIGTAPTLSRFGQAIGFDLLDFIFLREFWPDIKKKIRHR